MANTLTNLIGTIYTSLDTVSREMVGFIPAVRRDSRAEMAAKDQTIRFPIVPAASLESITPGATPASSGSQTIGSDTMTISKSYAYPILWNGEEQKGLDNNRDPLYQTILGNQFQQAFRTFANQIDTDIASLYKYASNAYGTAATTPFGTAGDFSDFAGARKILEDNGAPTSDLQMVLGSAAIANLRGKQSVLFKANEAGDTNLLRNGAVGQVEGFMIHNSSKVGSHTKGTAASATTNAAGYAVGATTITLAAAGTGTILAGDVITFNGDSNKYVVLTGDSDVSDGGTIELAEPGLKQAIAASATAITVVGTHTNNMVFDRNAIVLATRVPAAPAGGDGADDVMQVTDPNTGITYEIRMYRQYRQVKIEVCLAWGYKLVKPEHVGILLG